MCKNPSMRHCYSRNKIFTVEMQQRFWLSDWQLLLIYTCWMCRSNELELLLFIHQTPNFNYLHVQSKCLYMWNVIIIRQLHLLVSFFVVVVVKECILQSIDFIKWYNHYEIFTYCYSVRHCKSQQQNKMMHRLQNTSQNYGI